MDTNTNLMQHNKSVLFLISLSQRTIQEIEDKGVDYQLFLQIVRSCSHVEIHEEISEELIGTASQYNVVTIIGHNINDCIELADGSLFPMRKIACALPSTFDGYLHVAVCNSSIIFDAIKKYCPNSRVRTSVDFEELELDLLIYSELLKNTDLRKDTFDGFYESYYNKIKVIQEQTNPKDLANLPCATKLGTMATGERPFEVERNSEFSINITFHDESSEIAIKNNITNAHNISYKFDSILEKLNDGDSIIFDLRLDSSYPEMNNYLKGGGEHLHTYRRGAKSIVSYDCKVEAGFRLNSFKGILTIRINDEPDFVDIWNFRIGVTPHIDEPVKASNKLPMQVNIIGKRVSFTGIPIYTDVLNYFLPTKQLQEFLMEDWFKEIRTSETYDKKWTNDFISALMTKKWKNEIAIDWAIKGREKKPKIKSYIVASLHKAGVLKGNLAGIAKKISLRKYDTKEGKEVIMKYRTVYRYMLDGWKQPYADWVTSYVKGLDTE